MANEFDDDADNLLDYFEKSGWVNQEKEVRDSLSPFHTLIFFSGAGRKKPQFDHTLWNVYDDVVADLPRSNNSVEGWHNAFAICVTVTHPTIKKLAEKIRLEQSTSLNFFKVTN